MPKKPLLKIKVELTNKEVTFTLLDFRGAPVEPQCVSFMSQQMISCNISWEIRNHYNKEVPVLSYTYSSSDTFIITPPKSKQYPIKYSLNFKYTSLNMHRRLEELKKSMQIYYDSIGGTLEFDLVNKVGEHLESFYNVFVYAKSSGEFIIDFDNKKRHNVNTLVKTQIIANIIEEFKEVVIIYNENKLGVTPSSQASTCIDSLLIVIYRLGYQILLCSTKSGGVPKIGEISLIININPIKNSSNYDIKFIMDKSYIISTSQVRSFYMEKGLLTFNNNIKFPYLFTTEQHKLPILGIPRITYSIKNCIIEPYNTNISVLSLEEVYKTLDMLSESFNKLQMRGILCKFSAYFDGDIIKYNKKEKIKKCNCVTKLYLGKEEETQNVCIDTYLKIEKKHIKLFKNLKYTIKKQGESLTLNCNAKSSSITKNLINIKISDNGDALLLCDFKYSNTDLFYDMYKEIIYYILLKLYEEFTTKMSTITRLACTKTKRAKVSDYIFAVGCEYETGCSKLNIQKTLSTAPKSTNGTVYGWCIDGGGLELKTVIMENPNIFAYIGKFDALCKEIRKYFVPKLTASTHIHMSIKPKPKIKVPEDKKTQEVNPSWYGDAMFRKTLISYNWISLLNKYTLAFGFLDGFNPGGRRNTGYGMRLKRRGHGKDKLIFFRDTRFESDTYERGFTTVKKHKHSDIIGKTGRNSLVRTDFSKNNKFLHWEYRGTDACPSAFFMGLKIEFMQAIAKKAIQVSLDGEQLPLWDKKELKAFRNLSKVDSIFDINDVVCRKHAKKAIKELRPWLSIYAYKGLMAWVTYVNLLSEDTGTSQWFCDMEKMLISKIGIKHFITDADINSMFRFNKSANCYIPKKSACDKSKKFREVFTTNLASYIIDNRYSYIYRPQPTYSASSCDNCGASIRYSKNTKATTALCAECSKHIGFNRLDITNAKKFVEPTNRTKTTKALIEEIVNVGFKGDIS